MAVAARRRARRRRDGLKQVNEVLAKNNEGLTGMLATGLKRTEAKCKALAAIHGEWRLGSLRWEHYGALRNKSKAGKH